MKRISAGLLISLITVGAMAQPGTGNNTLLWKISGKGIDNPSYLFGTIHMICEDDAGLSENLKKIISNCEEVYFEVDMDNLIEMFGAMSKMKMRGDTTLQELLSEADYKKIKTYFEDKGSMLPFAILETFKPFFAASTLEQEALSCDNTAMMEQVIMKEAKNHNKKISGLETMSFQAGILDSIPYKLQAEQLLAFIDKQNSGDSDGDETEQMFEAYKKQDLDQLEKMILSSDAGLGIYSDLMLYKRNQNWVEKLADILPRKSVLIAVGAGHLPGEKGVISLLRKEGYTVTPVENIVIKTKEI